MDQIEEIADRIHRSFEERTAVRDQILTQARALTRHCAHAIRAAHRDERELARDHLMQAKQIVEAFREIQLRYPDLYYAGYAQDALKEYAESQIVFSLLEAPRLPQPEELELEYPVYLQGLAEAVGELRRRCLDVLLNSNPEEAERLLGHMDDIYAILVTMDYPDAITGGLRRLTDLARSIIERTRGEVVLSLRQEKLEKSLKWLENRLKDSSTLDM